MFYDLLKRYGDTIIALLATHHKYFFAKNTSFCNKYCTVKPGLTTTSEQQSHVFNDQPDPYFPKLKEVYRNTLFITIKFSTTATFFESQRLPLYTGLTVLHAKMSCLHFFSPKNHFWIINLTVTGFRQKAYV